MTVSGIRICLSLGLSCALVSLNSSGAELDPARVDWYRLEMQASKFFMKVNTSAELLVLDLGDLRVLHGRVSPETSDSRAEKLGKNHPPRPSSSPCMKRTASQSISVPRSITST